MEFISQDPAATVRGANVKATLDALQVIDADSRQIVEHYDLRPEKLTPDNFVPVQRWLSALKTIQEKLGEPALRETGIRIIENADFPAEYPTVESILLALNKIYYVNHCGDVGHYFTAQRSDGAVIIHCETPYPRNFERGLVEGICKNRRCNGALYFVEFEEGPANSHRTCTLTVHRV